MSRYLTTKLGGAKMALVGLGGRIINEICGLVSGEIYTTSQTNNLPKGYIQKGLGHVLGNKEMIDEGRERIKKSRVESQCLNQIIMEIKN